MMIWEDLYGDRRDGQADPCLVAREIYYLVRWIALLWQDLELPATL
jgi:hypothetical protein